MTTEELKGLAEVVANNRFHFKTAGIQRLAMWLEETQRDFNRYDWYSIMEPKRADHWALVKANKATKD